jgi:hypothetical protein
LKIREAEDALEKRIEKIRRSVEEDEEKLYDAKKILEDAKKYETTIRDMLRVAEEFRDAIREAKKDKKDKKKRNNRNYRKQNSEQSLSYKALYYECLDTLDVTYNCAAMSRCKK